MNLLRNWPQSLAHTTKKNIPKIDTESRYRVRKSYRKGRQVATFWVQSSLSLDRKKFSLSTCNQQRCVRFPDEPRKAPQLQVRSSQARQGSKLVVKFQFSTTSHTSVGVSHIRLELVLLANCRRSSTLCVTAVLCM